MSKVQIIIEGADCAEVLANLEALAVRLGNGGTSLVAVPAQPVAAEAPKRGRGRPPAEPKAAEETDPFAAPAATPKAATSGEAGSGASAAAPAASTIDLEDGEDGEPTYEDLSKAMNGALERVNGDPLKVQEALFRATGAKALKQLTTTGVKGGPIQEGKGASALAAFEAIGRE